MAEIRQVYLGVFLPEAIQATPAALLKLARNGVMEQGSLSYGSRYWQQHTLRFHPDPALSLAINELPPARLRDGGALPAYIRDALPDAWGRLVVAAAHEYTALDDLSLLCKTNTHRVGALVAGEQSEFNEPPQPELSLADLYQAAMQIQYEHTVPTFIRRLLMQGGSLGGARPKATIRHQSADWLAKFAMREDRFDVQRVEAGTLALAQLCGIRTPEFQTCEVHGKTVLLLKRFDRQGATRIHFLSASGLLNVQYESGLGSYVELAQAINRFGVLPRQDCQELFKRMMFNIFIDNTDDHIKNHGFLHQSNNQYRLSPVYDIQPQGTGLGYMGLSLIGTNNAPSLAQILAESTQFHFTPDEALAVIRELLRHIQTHWQNCFKTAGVSEQEGAVLAKVLDRVHGDWRREL